MDQSDNFEDVWPKDGACPCGQNDDARTKIIGDMMELAVDVHKRFVEKAICPTMMPTALGMLTAVTLAMQEKIDNPAMESVPMLTFPNVQRRTAEAFERATKLLAAANEAEGTA